MIQSKHTLKMYEFVKCEWLHKNIYHLHRCIQIDHVNIILLNNFFTTCGIADKCLLGPSMKFELSTNSIALYNFQI